MSAAQIKKTTKLGATGPEVFPTALGCMAMSGIYGKTSDDESIATIQEAIDCGVNLIDTGDFYGTGHNEMLVGRAIAGRRDKVHISVTYLILRHMPHDQESVPQRLKPRNRAGSVSGLDCISVRSGGR